MDYLNALLAWLERTPGVVVGAVLAALIASYTSRRTNRHSRDLQDMQLKHDANERERERAMSLRRDVYLPATEAIIRGQQSLGQVVNVDVPVDEIQKTIIDTLAACSKIHVIGSEATVRAVMAYISALMPAYFELLRLRVPIALKSELAKTHRAIADRAHADLARTTELMKQFNLSGQTDRDAWARLQRQSDSERRIVQDHAQKVSELHTENTVAMQAMGKRSSDLAIEVARHYPDALLAARNDLGLPIDEAAYRKLFAQQEADVIKATNEFFAEFEKLFRRPPA